MGDFRSGIQNSVSKFRRFGRVAAGLARNYLAATEKGRQPDLWGSAFAVHIEAAGVDRAKRVATYFKDHHAEVVQKGQLRHLPAGAHWEQACDPDTYQNGGYRATQVGWLINTLDLVDPTLADRTLVDLVNDFKVRGVNEWVFGDGTFPETTSRAPPCRWKEPANSAHDAGQNKTWRTKLAERVLGKEWSAVDVGANGFAGHARGGTYLLTAPPLSANP